MEQLALCLRQRGISEVVAARRTSAAPRSCSLPASTATDWPTSLYSQSCSLLLGLRQCFIRMRTPALSTAIRWPSVCTPSRQRLKSLWRVVAVDRRADQLHRFRQHPGEQVGPGAQAHSAGTAPSPCLESARSPKSAAGSITIDVPGRAPRAAARAVAPREPPRRARSRRRSRGTLVQSVPTEDPLSWCTVMPGGVDIVSLGSERTSAKWKRLRRQRGRPSRRKKWFWRTWRVNAPATRGTRAQ